MPAPIIGAAALAALRAAAIRQAGKKGGDKVGQKVGQKVAESIKAPKVNREGKSFNKKVEGPSTTTSRSGGKSVAPDATRVTGKTPKPTRKQVAGRQKAADTKRNKAIDKAKDTATKVATPIVGKARIKGQAEGATVVGLAALAYDKKKDSQKKKK